MIKSIGSMLLTHIPRLIHFIFDLSFFDPNLQILSHISSHMAAKFANSAEKTLNSNLKQTIRGMWVLILLCSSALYAEEAEEVEHSSLLRSENLKKLISEFKIPQEQVEQEVVLQEEVEASPQESPKISSYQKDVLLEVKAAYFRPTHHTFREIYNNGGGIYSFEITSRGWKNLYPWASVSYFTKDGHPIGGDEHTRVTLVPIGVGLKYFFPFKKYYDFYIGLGALATRLHTHDDSPFVIQNTTKWGAGGIAKAGFLFNFKKHFFIDLFGDYSYTKISISNDDDCCVERHDANVSGWSVGAGVGYRFR